MIMSGWTLAAAAVTALLVLLAVRWFRTSATLRGFEDAKAGISQFRGRLSGGKFSRENGDLILSGKYKGIPLTARFSHSEYSPGLYMTCPAPVNMVLSFASKDRPSPGGQTTIRTGDTGLDAQFVARTNQPTYAKMFLGSSRVLGQIRKLCASAGTMLVLEEYKFEFSEDLIPTNTLSRLIGCAEALGDLARTLEQMPGAHALEPKAVAPGRRPRVIGWGAAAAAIAIVVLAAAWLRNTKPAVNTGGREPARRIVIPKGVELQDARLLSDLNGWMLADPAASNPGFASWVDRLGFEATPKLALDVHGTGQPSSTAYLLASEKDPQTKRVVWIADRRVLCDIVGKVEGVARIPEGEIARVASGRGEAAVRTDGDGLLLVRDHSKPDMTLFFSVNNQLQSMAVSGL